MKTFCGYFDQGICNSCDLVTLDYPAQLNHKEKKLKTALAQHAGHTLLPSVSSPQLGFRNKAKLIVTGSLDSPIIGLVGEESLDAGREILSCPIHHPSINEILKELPAFISLTKLAPYNIKAKNGELKGLIIYYSPRSGESYLRFILRSKESLDRIKKHLYTLEKKFSHLTCISANIQPVPHAILEGQEEVFLTEKRYINHHLKDLFLRLGPKGFVQTNQAVAEKLYETAATWVKELRIQKFAELFSGQGAFSFFVSSVVSEGMGFEINAEAVSEANETARFLHLHHLKFKCADASEIGEELREYCPDLVLVNPPRRGLGGALEYFKKGLFPHLIYSSCNVDTLANDLKELSSYYEISRVQLFDMFPNSSHFETLVHLHLRK